MSPKLKGIKSRIKGLTKELNHHNYNYYSRDKPTISDSKYDALWRELEELEKKYPELKESDSPTYRIGSPALSKFKKYKHKEPMLGLSNAMNEGEFIAFDKRVKKLLNKDKQEPYYCELKFDGLSISMIYKNGNLVHAATRGDGKIGEEVTDNIRTISNVPLKLKGKNPPSFIEVRGEVVFPIKGFQELNHRRREWGEEPFANPRNAAAGSVRQLDSKLTAKRKLLVFAYSFGFAKGGDLPKTQSGVYEKLRKWGFANSRENKLCKSPKDVWKYYEKIVKKREELKFDIDGIVCKVNDLSIQKSLGFVGRSPRAMVAIKFPSRGAVTVLEDIIVQTGRTGVLSPVAVLKPVQIHGIVVSRASLHNRDEIERKDLRIGDHILVERSGDVIPRVVRALKEKRSSNSKKFIFPKKCPSCKSEVSSPREEVAIRCTSHTCLAQREKRIAYFVSKGGMNIVGLGPKVVRKLIEKEIIRSSADLYTLTEEQFLQLEGLKEKSAEKLLVAIADSKSRSLSRVICALGIQHVGEQLANVLSTHYPDLRALMKAEEKDLALLNDVGTVVAASIVCFFKNPENQKEINRLISFGINPKSKPMRTELKGKRFALTGALPSFSRKQASDLIVSHGGKVSSSVSKKTAYLLAGAEPGSKLSKAQALGIPVLSEQEFIQLIKETDVLS